MQKGEKKVKRVHEGIAKGEQNIIFMGVGVGWEGWWFSDDTHRELLQLSWGSHGKSAIDCPATVWLVC
jgi:hypothetical protein